MERQPEQAQSGYEYSEPDINRGPVAVAEPDFQRLLKGEVKGFEEPVPIDVNEIEVVRKICNCGRVGCNSPDHSDDWFWVIHKYKVKLG